MLFLHIRVDHELIIIKNGVTKYNQLNKIFDSLLSRTVTIFIVRGYL